MSRNAKRNKRQKKLKKKALLADYNERVKLELKGEYPHVQPVRIKARGDGWARLIEDFTLPVGTGGAELTAEHIQRAKEYLEEKQNVEEKVNPNERPVPITTLPELKKAAEDLREFCDTATFSVTGDELVMLKRCATFMLAAYQHEIYLRVSEKPTMLRSIYPTYETGDLEETVTKTKTEVSTFAGKSLEPTPEEARAWMEWRNKFYPGGLPQDNEWWSRLEGIMRGKAGRDVNDSSTRKHF